MKELQRKLYRNALITQKLSKLKPKERQEVVVELLRNTSARKLGENLGIPFTTLLYWKNQKRFETCAGRGSVLENIYNRLKILKAEDVQDWGKLRMVGNEISRLLEERK